MAPFTLDELASLTAEQAVRRRFDAQNFRHARWLFPVFAVIAFVEVLVSAGEGLVRPLVAGGHLLSAVTLALIAWRLASRARPGEGRLRALDPLARAFEGRSRGLALGVLVGQFLLLVFYGLAGGEPGPWLIIFPYLALFFRLAPAERLLAHGVFFATPVLLAVAGAPLGEDPDSTLPLLITVAVNGALPLGIGLLATRRARRSILREWSESSERYRDQLRMRQELDAAREIQLAMLPLGCPALPWLEVCTLSLPAMEVGGDYYDFFETAAQGLVVVSGDVAGHGVASGLVLAGLRSGLTLLADELHDPLAVLGKLHRMVQRTSRRRMIVTLALVQLDPERSTATVTSAGHPPVLHLRASDGAVEELSASSLPLGTQLAAAFGQRVAPFAPGDVFLVYSDGAYELVGEGGEVYGIERLKATLAAAGAVEAGAGLTGAPGATATEIRDAMLEGLWEFKGDAPQADDITLVVLRIRG